MEQSRGLGDSNRDRQISGENQEKKDLEPSQGNVVRTFKQSHEGQRDDGGEPCRNGTSRNTDRLLPWAQHALGTLLGSTHLVSQ